MSDHKNTYQVTPDLVLQPDFGIDPYLDQEAQRQLAIFQPQAHQITNPNDPRLKKARQIQEHTESSARGMHTLDVAVGGAMLDSFTALDMYRQSSHLSPRSQALFERGIDGLQMQSARHYQAIQAIAHSKIARTLLGDEAPPEKRKKLFGLIPLGEE